MQISTAESVVMEVMWRDGPCYAEQIVSEVTASRDWTAATVKTLLNRLLNKGAVQAERIGRRYLYTPVLNRDDYITQESQGLLDRLFDGQVAPLVSYFSEQQKLNQKDIAELKRLIGKLDDSE